MNHSLSFLLAASLLTLASAAQAQQPAGEAPATAPAAAPATAPAAAPVAAQAAAPAGSRTMSCEMGEVGGISPERARSWHVIFCDELARHGVSTAATGQAGTQGVYRLDILPLEKKILVRVTREKPAGVWSASERAELADADELLVALPRLVSALVKGESFEQTATTTNLTGGEVRPAIKRYGEMFVGGSLMGTAFPGMGIGPTPAIGLSLAYETPSLAAVADLRLTLDASDGNSKSSAEWISLSMGGRAFLSETDIAPFVGGGIGINWASFKVPAGDSRDSFQNSGFGLYGEVGIEALRTHRSRLSFGIRLDAPLYSMENRNDYSYVESSSLGSTPTARKTAADRYTMPVSLSATYYFP